MLRYKGIPYKGANKIADKVIDVCFCKFIAVGRALDGRGCPIHGDRPYHCEEGLCRCSDYRPNVVKTSPGHWPRCVCGHTAQMHN